MPCSMHSITAKHGCVPLFLPPSCWLLPPSAFRSWASAGAGLLAAVLAIVGIGLPVSYFYSFFRSVSRQIKQMHLPRAFYRVELADTGIAVWMYGQQDKPEPTSRHAWDSFYCAYRTDNAVYLYIEKEKAYLLNDRMEVVWKFLAGILPKEKLHDCRKG